MTARTYWYAHDLGIADEPLALSLIKYRQHENRVLTSLATKTQGGDYGFPNLVSSITTDGRQMPIIDLDFDHAHVESSSDGHAHLYLNVPISRWRWTALMIGLYLSKQVELGYFVWSIRRGGNFVRLPGTQKQEGTESTYSQYGWFRKLKKNSRGTD